MNIEKILVSTALFSVLAASAYSAAITTVSFDSGSRDVRDFNGTLLTGGAGAVDGNGAVLQLGYFVGATQANPFGNGAFIALSGEGSANTDFNTTSIGDRTSEGAGDGTFALALSFNDSKAATYMVTPPANTPLSIRFYNRATLAGSNFFETVSSTSSTWLWNIPAPNNPPLVLGLSLDDVNLRLMSTNTAPLQADRISTVTPIIPEPSTLALIAISSFFGVSRRQRK